MEELPLLERLVREHQADGFVVVSVNIDPADDEAARELMRLHGYPFTALSVPDPRWHERYGVRAAPANFLVDRAGRIVLQPSFDERDARVMAGWEIEALVARPPTGLSRRLPHPGTAPVP